MSGLLINNAAVCEASQFMLKRKVKHAMDNEKFGGASDPGGDQAATRVASNIQNAAVNTVTVRETPFTLRILRLLLQTLASSCILSNSYHQVSGHAFVSNEIGEPSRYAVRFNFIYKRTTFLQKDGALSKLRKLIPTEALVAWGIIREGFNQVRQDDDIPGIFSRGLMPEVTVIWALFLVALFCYVYMSLAMQLRRITWSLKNDELSRLEEERRKSRRKDLLAHQQSKLSSATFMVGHAQSRAHIAADSINIVSDQVSQDENTTDSRSVLKGSYNGPRSSHYPYGSHRTPSPGPIGEAHVYCHACCESETQSGVQTEISPVPNSTHVDLGSFNHPGDGSLGHYAIPAPKSDPGPRPSTLAKQSFWQRPWIETFKIDFNNDGEFDILVDSLDLMKQAGGSTMAFALMTMIEGPPFSLWRAPAWIPFVLFGFLSLLSVLFEDPYSTQKQLKLLKEREERLKEYDALDKQEQILHENSLKEQMDAQKGSS